MPLLVSTVLNPFFLAVVINWGRSWVEQWLAHEMEIEETDLPLDFVCEKVEFFCAQLPFASSMFRTEVAVEVASVCYFYVAAIYHFY